MDSFDAAVNRVSRALATGKIGQAVAVRMVAHIAVDHGWLERLARAALDETNRWIDSPWESIAAMGSIQRGELTSLVRFKSGATALVTVGSCGAGPPILEAVVVGNRGVLSSEGSEPLLIDNANPPAPRNSQSSKALLNAAILSCEQGVVVTADGSRPAAESISRKVLLDRKSTNSHRLKPHATPYGVLLIAGHYTHQPMYAPALAADSRCKLIGLVDEHDISPRRREHNARYAAELSIPLLDDLEEALAREDVHIVSICAEPARRGKIILKAAQAGKHLYLDKPLASSVDDAAAIVEAVDGASVVSHMFSFVRSPLAMNLRQVLDSGRLGTLIAAHFDLTFAKGTNGTAALGDVREETAKPEVFELPDSKRELTNIGVYPLAMLTWLTRQQATRVFATTGNYFFAEHQRNDMEDFGQVLMQLDDGLTASVSVGRTGWTSHPGFGLNRTHLIGTEGAAVIDLSRPRVEMWSAETNWSPPKLNPEDPMGMWVTPADSPFAAAPKDVWTVQPSSVTAADVSYFLDCIESAKASELSAIEAAQTTQILTAAYRSAATGNIVRLVS